MPGVTTSQRPVENGVNPSAHGVWLLVDGKEYFLPYDAFPWFRGCTAEQLVFEQPMPGHLYWPALDVDLTLAMIEHPEGYPLVAH